MGKIRICRQIQLYEAYSAAGQPGNTPDVAVEGQTPELGFYGVMIPNMYRGPEAVIIDIPFGTLDELIAKGTKFAEEAKNKSGHGYSVSFVMDETVRKPPGFDARTRSVYVGLTPEVDFEKRSIAAIKMAREGSAH